MIDVQPPYTRSALPAVDYESLLQAFADMFEQRTNTMQWGENDRPVLTEDYPRIRDEEGGYDHKFDVILMHIAGAEPSPVASGAAAIGGTGTGKSSAYRNHEHNHPTKGGYKIVTSTWREDVLVSFTILAKSNKRANQLANWFHRTMMLYIHGMKFFQTRGVNWSRFVRRLADHTTKEYGQELYARPLEYIFRLELSDVSEIKTLEVLDVSLVPVAT